MTIQSPTQLKYLRRVKDAGPSGVSASELARKANKQKPSSVESVKRQVRSLNGLLKPLGVLCAVDKRQHESFYVLVDLDETSGKQPTAHVIVGCPNLLTVLGEWPRSKMLTRSQRTACTESMSSARLANDLLKLVSLNARLMQLSKRLLEFLAFRHLQWIVKRGLASRVGRARGSM